MNKPIVTRRYQNHHLDSARWEGIQPRPDDVIVATSYKSGTTYTQGILAHMFYGPRDPMPSLGELSPWPDARFHPITHAQLLEWANAIPKRRILKSHLPLDGLPYFEQTKYLVVARDPRDVFMSFVNHYGNYTQKAYGELNGGDRQGPPLPPFPEDDVRGLWKNWITRGWFSWESEGWPFWGNMQHTQTYWEWRALPNLCLLHYADMRRDPEAAVRTIADFVEHDVSDADVARIVEESSFERAKERAIQFDAEQGDEPRQFRGGEAAFIYKGTNGRWRDILNGGDLALYEQAKSRVLSPDCARWLEEGGPVT